MFFICFKSFLEKSVLSVLGIYLSTQIYINLSSQHITKRIRGENVLDNIQKTNILLSLQNSYNISANKTSNNKHEYKSFIGKHTSIKDYFNSNRTSRPDLIILSFGRLGNQLFHYTVNFCAALLTHRTPTLYKQSVLYNLFPYLSAKKIDYYYGIEQKGEIAMELKVGEHGHWSSFNDKLIEELKVNNKSWLGGCFQSWKYFIGCEKAIRTELIFNSTIQMQVNIQLQIIAKDYTEQKSINFFDITFIGIHVRRDDVTWPVHTAKGYTSAPSSYIQHAMDYFNQKFLWPVFIVTSEDIIWCRKNINLTLNNVYFSPFPKAMYLHDFTLLVSCNHSIITVGSYGWFAAWLCGGQVIYYKNFPIKGSTLERGVNKMDRYPPSWRPMY